MHDFAEFQFTAATLDALRPPGISAYMRIKNEEQFIRLAIESHLPFYDEIVAVYNDCTDNTEEVLLELQAQHPDKVKVFHYLPKVHTFATREHAQTPTDSVHSFANYSNYALAKTTYSTAVKLDADHLAIPCKLASLTKEIRADIVAGEKKFYMVSGINLIRQNDTILAGGKILYPFSGNGDHFCHPVSSAYHYENDVVFEKLIRPPPKQVERKYMGITYFHLKYLKQTEQKFREQVLKDSFFVPWNEFCTESIRRKMIADRPLRDRIDIAMYSCKAIRKLKFRLTKKHPNIYKIRLVRLKKDLAGIDFKRDLLDKLP